jgi:hypothetical protein
LNNRTTSRSLDVGDAKTKRCIDGIEASVNELCRKTQRPGGRERDDAVFERKSAEQLCITRYQLSVPKDDGSKAKYVPSSNEIHEARLARKALNSLFRHGDAGRLDPLQKKSLPSFSFARTRSFLRRK